MKKIEKMSGFEFEFEEEEYNEEKELKTSTEFENIFFKEINQNGEISDFVNTLRNEIRIFRYLYSSNTNGKWL